MNCSNQHIYSSLASDPDFSDLVVLYVEEMPGRLEQIKAAHLSGDRETLIRLIHQLKGAAGSYGFSAITEEATIAEQELMSSDADADQVIKDLLALCEKVRVGTGD